MLSLLVKKVLNLGKSSKRLILDSLSVPTRLSTRASGTAWSVHKHAGDQVKKGEVLALIASPELASLKFDLQQTLLTVQTREHYYQRLKSSGESTSRRRWKAPKRRCASRAFACPRISSRCRTWG